MSRPAQRPTAASSAAASRGLGSEWLGARAPGLAPGAPALIDPRRHQTLTYGQLCGRVYRLARHLRDRGVGPEVRVGVLFERSVEDLVGLLAVLEAGGAYVPLDRSYPPARLGQTIDEAGLGLLLVNGARDAERRLARGGLPTLDPHRERLAIRHRDGSPLALAVDPASAAYVIFTSGSTGRPKGVVIERRSLARYVEAAIGHYAIDSSDRVLQLASLSFDLSVGEIFPTLAAGATLIPYPEPRVDAIGLLDFCRRWSITSMLPATAVWHQLALLLAEDPAALPPSLERVAFGSERVSAERLAEWRRQAPRVATYNAYGPTEATVESTVQAVGAIDGTPAELAASVGESLPGVRVRILDRDLEPVAAGRTGEVCLGGFGVARGYLRRPALTALSFVPDPLGEPPGARLFRTGDLGRLLPDGRLELSGRLDRQVKIRGVRVEPGEIEAALVRHPDVAQAAVLARRDAAGGHQLHAYVVPRRAADGLRLLSVGQSERVALSAGELRRALARELPAQLVPSRIDLLDELPLTAHHKVDLEALSARRLTRADLGRPYRPPTGARERALAAIWEQLLRVDQIGVDDDFFELGGDSILAMQIIARAAQADIRLTAEELFLHPTVAELARRSESRAGRRPAVDQAAVSGAVVLTPIQRWFFDEYDPPQPSFFNQSLMVEMGRPVPPGRLDRAVALLLRHHDALRTRFERADGATLAAVRPDGGEPPSVTVDLGHLPDAELRAAIEERAGQAQGSLDLERGPIIRFVQFDAGPTRPARLLIVVHHTVMDAVSWGVLLEDLERALVDLEAGAEPRLPPKTTSVRDWALLLQAEAQAETTLSELPYWLAVGARARPLPRDSPEGGNTRDTEETLTAGLDLERTRRLLRQVPAVFGTRINDVLLTALAAAFGDWTGRPLLVELESHGRHQDVIGGVDLSRTLGWFTSTYPVFLAPGRSADAVAALRAVSDGLAAVPRHGLGYYLLRHLCRDPRVRGELRSTPQPEVTFNYLGQLDALFEGSALFSPASEARGAERPARGRRPYLLEVDGGVVGGRLLMHWTYSGSVHRRATIEGLANRFVGCLEELVDGCDARRPRARRGRGSAAIEPASGRIRPWADPESAPAPLALAQRRYWGRPHHRHAYLIALRGPLDRPALERSVAELRRRHRILRSRFFEVDGRPLQQAQRHRRWPLPARAVPMGADRDKHLARQFDLLLRPFPRRGPFFRARLLRLGPREHWLAAAVHHIVFDGWSWDILERELMTIYDAFRRGRPSPLEPPSLQYDEVARRQLTDEAMVARRRRAADYWQTTLRGLPRVALPRPASPTAGPEALIQTRATVDAGTREALEGLARRERATTTMVVLTAYQIQLARLTRSTDVAVELPVSGRPSNELQGVVGCFVRDLAVRMDLDGDPSLRELLRQTRRQVLAAYEHQDVCLVSQATELGAVDGAFDLPFNFNRFDLLTAPCRCGSLEVERIDAARWTHLRRRPVARRHGGWRPLHLYVGSADGGLELELRARRRFFDRVGLDRTRAGLLAVLDELARSPDRRLSALPDPFPTA